MPIPNFNQSNVLPPFLPGKNPTLIDSVAPYRATLKEFIELFNTSDKRRKILIGFLKYRLYIKSLGFVKGFQWLDGSFLENIEKSQERNPNDIDLVTFAERPMTIQNEAEWSDFIDQNFEFFIPERLKTIYFCDAYFIDLGLKPDYIVKNTAYWFGLFSHQRETFLWKGMVEIALSDSEDSLISTLELEEQNA
ncbi:hypothetical protein LPTSP3_g30930 [Leptospira kobayashii]|uniref:Uncharacterized protein n=1 Tax=Leptospira kobayashii TaxID=1917830 RepID=A0ABN6KL17_9LEPT|nr:hypothetical protein [Leptospira kobayashii]BDA80163.1 hypothetical protein LPTSP3_g30930 [Leptospira kobayashii]